MEKKRFAANKALISQSKQECVYKHDFQMF